LLTAGTANAETIPPPIEKMIRAAAATGDATKLATTVDLAKKTYPDSAKEIDALVADLNKAAEEARVEKLKSESFFQGWHGHGEAGATVSTGNTDTTGVALGLAFNKEGLHWRHAFNATADYERTNGTTDKERYFVGYEGNYKFSDRAYALGLVSWEKDRFSGFSSRFSESLGIGYSVIKQPNMTLNIEGGPALRQTSYLDGTSDNKFGGRGALGYHWTIHPGIVFSEDAVGYLQGHDDTFTSTTALDMKLIGALSGRVSFFVKYESDPPLGLETTDTTTRFTLVYGF
jgi:putative salt-induced outer membrane protein